MVNRQNPHNSTWQKLSWATICYDLTAKLHVHLLSRTSEQSLLRSTKLCQVWPSILILKDRYTVTDFTLPIIGLLLFYITISAMANRLQKTTHLVYPPIRSLPALHHLSSIFNPQGRRNHLSATKSPFIFSGVPDLFPSVYEVIRHGLFLSIGRLSSQKSLKGC